MMRSPDDVIQNVKRALHNTHTTSQSVTNSLQHPETLNIPLGHLEGFFQNRLNLFLIFFQPQELLLPLIKTEQITNSSLFMLILVTLGYVLSR